ncbi:MAG: lipopolysaccharide biosynthesis protein [Armatimonadota bacterium]
MQNTVEMQKNADTPPSVGDNTSLRVVATRAFGLFGISEIVSKIVSLGSGVVLARLLSPKDYGVVAAAGLLIEFSGLFNNVGIGAAVVQRRDRVKEAMHTGFIIQVTLALVLVVFVFMISPLWAAFYRRPEVGPVVRVLAFGMLFNALIFAPSTMLSRELKFGLMCIPEIGASLAYGAAAIPLALTGASHWSLVGGITASNLVSLALWYRVSSYRPSLQFDRRLARELWDYGKHVLATGVLGYFVIHVDDLAVGRMLGMAALGYYAFAYRWGNWAATDLVRLVNRITFPAYAKIQDDLQRVRNAYFNSLQCVGIFVVPISFGLFAVAPDFVGIVFGKKWMPAVLPLQLLVFFGLARSIGSIGGSVRQGIGRPDITARLTALQFVLSAGLMVPMIQLWGLLGAVASVLMPAVLTNFLGLIANQKLFGADLKQVGRVLFWPTVSSVLMTVAVRLASPLLMEIGLPGIVRLGVLIAMGTAVYSGTMLVAARRELHIVASSVRMALRPQGKASSV